MSAPGPSAADAAVLGVESSLTGKRWRARLADARMGLALAQRLELPEIVGRVMAGRGVTLDTADAYLNPTLRALLPDPSHLRDMDKAASRLADAVMAGERIGIFGDYDVDGATSAALLHRFLSAVGAPPRLYIPDRMAEGYGPNAPALRRLASEGLKIVVTVDCGIVAFEALEAGAEAGLDVIVVDHHVAEPRLPRAHAVVNPNRLDETSALKQLAAVGVAFMLAIATNRALRAAGWYGAARPAPDLLDWLDVVALGTVCDVVPLTGLNRALVTQGLKIMARRANAGLAALADVARLDEPPATYHAGFVLGPRVNAGGRVGEADLGVRLLTTEDPVEAAALAKRLDAHNRERQALEARALDGALAQAMGETGPLVLVAHESWHPGVIGIVASRLVERFNRPAAVVAFAGAEGKGSARSVPGVDMGAAVIAARQAGHLANGGGHPMAAGFTVSAAKLDELRAFLAERIGAEIARNKVVPALALDGALALGAATPELAARLEQLAPFGVGNAEPCFAVPDARIVQSSVVGEGHVRAILADKAGARLKAIAFRAADQPLGKALLDKAGASLHVAGRLRPDNWQGRSEAQLIIADAAWAR